MGHDVLLVFNRNKESLVEDIRELLYEQVFIDGVSGLIDRETSLDLARERLIQRPYSLAIVDLHAPAGRKEASQAEDRLGLEWVRELQASGIGVPTIIVCAAPDQLVNHQASKLKDCRALALGEHFSDLLVEMSTDALRGQNAESRIFLELEIYIADSSDQPWFKLHGTIDNEVIDRQGVLEIDPDTMDDLRDRCHRNIPNLQKGWAEELKGIGKHLFKELFVKNYPLSNALDTFMAKIDPEKQFKFRFKVGKTAHPLVLEAIFEDRRDLFWMLRYPICRQIAISGDYHELFIGRPDRRQPINCLIITSDVHEYVAPIGKRFDKLDNIQDESDFLQRFLLENHKSFNIGKVHRIDGPDPETTFAETLRKALNDEKFHLVHYAGHSYYDAEKTRGYLILPGRDYPEVLDIEEFSAWLRKSKTQFVFLSSCHSSEEDFVFELASKKIPAILGFRWDLDDARAYAYAQSFYQQLFQEGHRLEYALLEARKAMFAADPQDRTWAAPMLVLQTSSP